MGLVRVQLGERLDRGAGLPRASVTGDERGELGIVGVNDLERTVEDGHGALLDPLERLATRPLPQGRLDGPEQGLEVAQALGR